MSDLYSARVLSLSSPFDLDQAVERAAHMGLNPTGARRILERAPGPYVAAELRYAVDHGDADRLDRLTPGLVHLLLADVVASVETAGGGKLAKLYADNRPAMLEKAGCVFTITASDAQELRLSVICSAQGAPSTDTLYVSTAWAPDRVHVAKHDPRAELRCFPPPGLAGAIEYARNGLMHAASVEPFTAIKKSLEVGGLAAIGSAVYAVSHVGGHIATLTAKEAKRLGKPDPADAKRPVRSLHATADRLWIAWDDEGWTAVDPTTGARASGPGPELKPPAPVIESPIDIGGRVLEPTPDPDTLLFATDAAHYLVHVPTRAITLRLPTAHGPRVWVEGKRPVLWIGSRWSAAAYRFDLR